jgi:hypothetical protein
MTRSLPRLPARVRGAIGIVSVAALASVVTAGGSCGTAAVTVPTPASPDSVHLTYGTRATVKGTTLAFTFGKIVSDSRCAEDVVCVWAGELRVQVRAENLAAAGPQPMTQLLEFSTNNQRVQQAFGHQVELIAERPRGRGQPPPAESYWVALRVTL